jgi:exoribonuclease II
MNQPVSQEIVPGTVLEFFESKEILCGVVLAVKDSRFNVLSERNREVNVTRTRAIHHGRLHLDPGLSRDELLKRLASIAQARKDLMTQIDVEELWALLEGDSDGFEAREISEFIFSKPVSDDQVAAVQRLLLQDRLYFQVKDSTFYTRSAENVENRRLELERESERERKLEVGARWLETIWNRRHNPPDIEFREEILSDLKNYALFGQDAKESAFTKEILKEAGIPPQPQSAFRILVKTGIWKEDENLLLHENGITPEFPSKAIEHAAKIPNISSYIDSVRTQREDLTGLDIFTVDSLLTRDYDDALSARDLEGGLVEVGIHIADAAEFVSPGDPLDLEAESRASSIYLPDDRICMLPPLLSEGICSLKAGADRLGISFLLKVDAEANIIESRIVPSIIRIREQLTYEDVTSRIEEDRHLKTLHQLALKLRQRRLDKGAIILPLPEIQVYVNSVGMIQVSCYDKETPSQILVSEWMIAANAAAGDYLAERGIPAIFRGQAECRQETEFVQTEFELFKVYRQRRLFSRASLDTEPKPHCSLAIPNYTTVTSPIRRYADLVVQRQLKHALVNGSALYSKEELEQLIIQISAVQAKIFLIQRKWTRYWILKYIEQEDLEILNALVLDKNARFAHLLIPDFLLEANAPVPENSKFHQGERVRIRIEKVIPRDDILKIQVMDVAARSGN